jgi:general secretion pathway protein J
MSRAPASGAAAGFTLIELLVAMTLLGILMTALFGGLSLGSRVWETSDRRLEDGSRAQAVRDFLTARLGETLPVSIEGPLFAGSADSLRFASPMPAHLGAGIYMLELGLDASLPADRPRDLLLRWQKVLTSAAEAANPVTGQRVLLEGIAGLELAYFGALGERGESAWREQWQGADNLPRLIDIEITFPPGDPRRFPPLAVRPMVSRWYDPSF